MSSKCAKCHVVFAGAELTAKCVECSSVFHPACTRAGSAQNFTKIKNKAWKCDVCNESSVRSNELEDNKSVLAALSALKVDIYSKIDEKIDPVQMSINQLSTKFNDLTVRLTNIEEVQDKLNVRCKNLEQDCDQTNTEVLNLQLRIHELEQHSRCANVEVQGIPVTRGEDVYYILEGVAKAIGTPFKRDDISMAHRLRLFSDRHAHPPIIAQFTSRRTKEDWLRAARNKKKLDAKDVHPNLQSSQVFINEQLTPHNKQLLGKARRLVREKKLHSARFVNGKVLVQTKEGVAATRVTFLSDLDKLTP